MSAPINSANPDSAEAYISVADLKQRIDYEPADFFQDSHNQYKRFDDLLERLRREATAIVDTNTGDQTWARETERVDLIQNPSGRIIPLVYPVVEVLTVEWLRLENDGTENYREISEGRWRATKHGVKLRSAQATSRTRSRSSRRPNPLTQFANAREWSDLAREFRVTYTRGYETIPENIQQVTTTLVNRALRNLKNEQNVAATSPDELAGVSPAWDRILSEGVQEQLDGLTTLGRATYTV